MSSRVPSGGGEGQQNQDFGERIRARVAAGRTEAESYLALGEFAAWDGDDGPRTLEHFEAEFDRLLNIIGPGNTSFLMASLERGPVMAQHILDLCELLASTTPPEVAVSVEAGEMESLAALARAAREKGWNANVCYFDQMRRVPDARKEFNLAVSPELILSLLASATTKAGREDDEAWVMTTEKARPMCPRCDWPMPVKADSGGEQSSPSAEASNLSPEQMTAHSGIAYGDLLASERAYLDETERLCGLLSELADAAESGQWVTHPSDYKISRKRLDDAIAAARSTLNPSATRPKAAPKNVSPSGSLPDTATQLQEILERIRVRGEGWTL